MDKPYCRFIGDVHGHQGRYVKLATEADYSIQVGDMGFNYDKLKSDLPYGRHWFLGGNHDNYTRGPCPTCGNSVSWCDKCRGRGWVYSEMPQHYLGDHGIVQIPKIGNVFFVRGAWSIDQAYRTPMLDWFEDEECDDATFESALSCYQKCLPDIMVTHTCPRSIVPHVPFRRLFGKGIIETRTDKALDWMLVAHRPKLWIFGHYHVSWTEKIDGTTFKCLNELESFDLSQDFDAKAL